ncbi:hypothetical protein HK107_00855 [Parvularcula sp. ZS-1/3]|uniref:PEP-CTERM sorting domain-containing protein n=1 Tax=Parvularcula mediterranea TaxID=2732508 RepID=A0A7Y3W3L2_9PROT|nr:hypothetical protein [Parvularcula mediterranea]NNU14870.1 hypothetical protein [Parvularcula mediterranea]
MKTLIAAALAAFTLGSAAQATTIYADAVDWQNNGTVGSSNNRDNPLNALGAPDGSFLALGLTNADGSNPGFAVFSFGASVVTGPATVWEVTFNCRQQQDGSCSYPESVDVYYGTDYAFGSNDFSDLSDFTFAGTLFNGDANSGASVIVNDVFRYIALVDASKRDYPNGPSTDGFDVDSVSVAAVPIPAAALLFAPVAFALRRRAKK